MVTHVRNGCWGQLQNTSLHVILLNFLHHSRSFSFLVHLCPKIVTAKIVALHEALLPSVPELKRIDTLLCVIWVIFPHQWGRVLAGFQLVEYCSTLKLEHMFVNRQA